MNNLIVNIESASPYLEVGEWLVVLPVLKFTLCEDNRYMAVLGEGDQEERFFKPAADLQQHAECSVSLQEALRLIYSEILV